MKRFALILTVVGALAAFTTTSANATDANRGHGYAGHGAYSQGYAGHGVVHRGFAGHGYSASAYGGRGYVGHGYSASSYGGHGYYGGGGHSSYGRVGGLSISTPHFGLRIGH